MKFRALINGTPEPLWRTNARDDADKFLADLGKAPPSRRAFLAGAGAGVLAGYLDSRRAVALPRGSGLSPGGGGGGAPGSIINARLGSDTTYPNIPAALVDMISGDTLLLPAGPTYLYGGVTQYYSHWQNTDSTGYGGTAGDGFNSMYLGSSVTSAYYSAILTADYGTIQGAGTANNGRALVTPPIGILVNNLNPGDTVIYFNLATPVASWHTSGTAYIDAGYNLGQFANYQITYTGIDAGTNALTGVSTGSIAATVPAGTMLGAVCSANGKGIFVTCGQNPGWTFNNLEIAWTMWSGDRATMSPIRQSDSYPGQVQVGSFTTNNCFLHDCRTHPGIGYTGIGSNATTFAHMFDTELFQIGAFDQTRANTHNVYIGHVGEFIMDNCYSHKTNGTWLAKSRANFNFFRYCQFLGQRTDANPNATENSGVDISNGGLTYRIGNIIQQSNNAAQAATFYNAENPITFGGGPVEGGSPNPLQELYVSNETIIGSQTGSPSHSVATYAPFMLWGPGVWNPEIPFLSQGGTSTLPARSYWVQNTMTGASGGETTASPLYGDIGGGRPYETLAVPINKLITVASPLTRTGTAQWNCYMGYAGPVIYATVPTYPFTQTGNQFFWNADKVTSPIFSQTSGGTTISITGTLTNGSQTITAISALSGVGTLAQLLGLAVYVGTAQGLSIDIVDEAAGTLHINSSWGGSTGSVTISFGHYVYVGFTYATALGDSANEALVGQDFINPAHPWIDGNYGNHTDPLYLGALYQVDPGNKLVVAAPPSGPTWATGVNIWLQDALYWAGGYYLSSADTAGTVGLSKQTSAPVAFGASWTSPANILTKAQSLNLNMFKQNAIPINVGTNFTEPNTALANHNSTTGQLQWQRRAASRLGQGGDVEIWFAKVTGTLTGYVETIYLPSSELVCGVASVWRGVDATTPFDTNFFWPACQEQQPMSIDTALTNDTVLSVFRTNATGAGTGFTLLGAVGSLCNAQYAPFTTAQTGLAVGISGGGASTNAMIVDVLHGTSGAPTLVGSAITINTTANKVNFTVPSAAADDYIVLLVTPSDSFGQISGIGLIGTPLANTAVGVSPVVLIQNTICCNYNPGFTGGNNLAWMEYYGAPPSTNVTQTTNLYASPWNGSTFGSPSFGTVFADSNQTHYNYALAGGSPALNAASNPGSSPYGQSLIPVYQSSYTGTVTPGTPIPPKTPRSDIGPALTGAIGALKGS